MSKRVAFQGSNGALSEKAARDYFHSKGIDISTYGEKSFEFVFEGVTIGKYDCAVVPIENSLSGSIHSVFEQLLTSKLFIVGECVYEQV